MMIQRTGENGTNPGSLIDLGGPGVDLGGGSPRVVAILGVDLGIDTGLESDVETGPVLRGLKAVIEILKDMIWIQTGLGYGVR